MAKATFRLPEYILDELRDRSRNEDRSLNAVAVDVLRRGLGHTTDEALRAKVLGSLIVKPATRTYDAESLARRLTDIPCEQRDLTEALHWTREDRF